MKNNIKKYIDKKGMNMKQTSELSGVPYRTLQNWVDGTRIPRDVYQIEKLARALDCTIYDLIDFE
ncbi:helix-turn-helix domain-containing protein [Anaerostipes sp. AF04-45]|uniref:Helix-turn-helix domain protein n=1 Tax=Siphoviridae sp. ctLkp13 TaxID=2826252 RepID=A0A8S5LT38_9CAUD|nr:helix-turn-helix transcriptional regulator [Anaerostipes sp. AF04-45]RGH26125.1 XRE family transcriptional regulator [Anaerostipes sp. AF04-45]DAD72999.1 MAG TPA: helix-turn-helix domain protein [Siphoviridae sp. ctLkp13]